MKAEIKRITELSQIERQKREDEMYLAENMNIEIEDLKKRVQNGDGRKPRTQTTNKNT